MDKKKLSETDICEKFISAGLADASITKSGTSQPIMTAPRMWMVRAGEGGLRFEEFEREGIVGIGWPEMGDMAPLRSREDFVRRVELSYPGAKKA